MIDEVTEAVVAVTQTRVRRSNRIASQQHHQYQLELESEPPSPQSQQQQPRKSRRRKQGKPAPTATASSVERQLSVELTGCLVTTSELASSLADFGGSCFLVCFDCRFATMRLSAYLDHVTRLGHCPVSQVYRCRNCRDCVTSQPELMLEHLSLSHGVASTVPEGSRALPPISTGSELTGHVEAPPTSPPSQPLAQRHACPDCGKRFRQRYRLMRHRLAVHDPAGGKQQKQQQQQQQQQLACRLCCKLFKSRRSYLVHRLAYHHHQAAATTTDNVAGDAEAADAMPANADADCVVVNDPQPFKCRYCEMKFAQKTAFARHQAREHPSERPYVCSQCGRGFKFQHSLAMHERLHRGELTCHQCDGRVFYSDREYNEHLASVHEGSLTFLCESCGRTFPTQYKLSRHSRVHNRSRQHACPECGRHFHRMDKLKLHLQCVHSAERPHLCHLCGRAFNRRDKLAEHVKQHSLHRCQLCPAAFPMRSDLRRHVAAEHRLQRKQPQQQPPRQRQRQQRGDKTAEKPPPPNAQQQLAEAPLDLLPPAPQFPPPPQPQLQPPSSPLGDALITIATGGLLPQPANHQQIIFLESFDQSFLLSQPQPHPQTTTLTLYSPVTGAYYTTTAAADTVVANTTGVELLQ